MRHSKFITALNGLQPEVCGNTGDAYFDALDDHCEDDFFKHVVSSVLKNGSVAIDVGANVGWTTCILRSQVGESGKVFSFEPSPTAFPCLQDTIRANKFHNCESFNFALSDTPGTLRFMDDPNSASASHLVNAVGTLGSSSIDVEVSTIDEFQKGVNLDSIDLIKIDVEGFELAVLRGAQGLIASQQPDVFLEINTFTLVAYGNENPRKLLTFLMEVYPYVYYRNQPGEIVQIKDPEHVFKFFVDNMLLRGLVSDVFCSARALC